MLFYLAFLPLYLDPDGSMYPPISIDDRHRFGVLNREATMRAMHATYHAYYDAIKEWNGEAIGLWHLRTEDVRRNREYLLWLREIYDDIDTLACNFNTDGRYLAESWTKALKRLQWNLGPIDYQLGIVPAIPEWVFWK